MIEEFVYIKYTVQGKDYFYSAVSLKIFRPFQCYLRFLIFTNELSPFNVKLLMEKKYWFILTSTHQSKKTFHIFEPVCFGRVVLFLGLFDYLGVEMGGKIRQKILHDSECKWGQFGSFLSLEIFCLS